MKVCFIAAPLTARSGVYRSAREIVEQARSIGLDWSLYIAVSQSASGRRPLDDPDWVVEESWEPSGVAGVVRLASHLRRQKMIADADILVSLIPQTDMALSITRFPWVAFLRGLPWPDERESSPARKLIWKLLEQLALRRAREVWATTDILASQVTSVGPVRLVPAGIRPLRRTWDGVEHRDRVIWAARFDRDKNPALFLDVLEGSVSHGVMYGSGPLRDDMQRISPANVEIGGWVDPDHLWDGALAYVGTSSREAFGRSAVEASMNGIPVIISNVFGAAGLLYTDPGLAATFVLDTADPASWRKALSSLESDVELRRRVSAHVWANANKLTIANSVERIRAALDNLVEA